MQFDSKISWALGLGIVVVGCQGEPAGNKTGAMPTAPSVQPLVMVSVATPAGSTSAASLPKKRRTKTREAPNPTKMAEYRKHLTEGRLLASKSTFPEAIREFEKALVAVPGDAPVLMELGWAHFKAGELDKAKKRTEEGLTRTTRPQLKGMGRYNLGRIAEEKKEYKEAVDQYQISLALRPNEIVEKRLADLAKKANITVAVNTAAEPLPCQNPVASVADVCTCMIKPQPDDMAPRTCEAVKDFKTGREDLAFVEVAVSDFETCTYAVAKSDQGFLPIAKVGSEYNPGAFGISESFELKSVSEKPAGKAKVLWIESSHGRHDSNIGIDEYDEAASRLVTVCVPPAGDVKTWKCPLSVPVEVNYLCDRIGIEGFTPDEETRKLMTKGLPLRSSWSLGIKLSDGKADVTVTSGEPSAEILSKVKSYSW